MTINGLTINERLIDQFKTNATRHYQDGRHFPAHKARQLFFAALRQDYDMNTIVGNLADLMSRLTEWETETHERLHAA